MSTILVTGASGNVGREVVRAVLAGGMQVIAADRSGDRTAALLDERIGVVRLDFEDPTSWESALQGVHHMFLMRPPAISNVETTLNPFIDFARARGVEHVVFLSVAGAGKNKLVPHRKVEDHLRELDDRYTHLRPGFFAQNLQSAYRQDIVEDDRIYVPAGNAQVNWIDVRDIAEVAALVLADPRGHRGQSYTLTGPGPVPWSEVTSALTTTLGRPIRYEPASVHGYVLHLLRRRTPLGAVAVQTLLHFLLRFGQGAGVDTTLERLLGRPGRSVRDYVADHVESWRKPGWA